MSLFPLPKKNLWGKKKLDAVLPPTPPPHLSSLGTAPVLPHSTCSLLYEQVEWVERVRRGGARGKEKVGGRGGGLKRCNVWTTLLSLPTFPPFRTF